ncbi:MAG: VPLPA-CTERM sorting domain-containing protein [Parvularculaceae bacterium]|nr:VPLPA-CTERM sorting domain-containing protein [Parvularculaceae bacterium]
MELRALTSALAGLAALIAAGTAHAAVYVYTGNNFTTIDRQGPTTPADPYTTADRVTITITLASPLGANLSNAVITPTAFSFFDGVNTITNTPAIFSVFSFSTNSDGAVVNWFALARLQTLPIWKGILSSNEPTGLSTPVDSASESLCGPGSTVGCAFFGDPFYSQTGSVRSNPGAWALQADPNVVPLPAGAWLMLTGIAGIGGLSVRRKRAA